MSKTKQMILCERCGRPCNNGEVCQGCGYFKDAPYKCDLCGDAVDRRTWEALRACILCAEVQLDMRAREFAELDAKLRWLKGVNNVRPQ